MSRYSPSIHLTDASQAVTRATVVSVLVPMSGVFSAELLVTAGMVGPALRLYAVTLLGCTLLPLRMSEGVPILSGFALLAAFRLVNVSMPVFVDLTVYWLPLVYVPFVVAGAWFLARSEGLDLRVDRRGTLRWLPVAVVAGGAVGVAQSWLGDAPALLPAEMNAALGLLAGIIVLGTVAEELLFRGILQSALRPSLGSAFAVVVTSVVFAAMQTPFGSSAVAVGFGAGLIYGLGYELSDSLAVPVVCRVTANVLLFVVFPAAAGV